MKPFWLLVCLVCAVCASCGPIEVRIDQSRGIPPVKGSVQVKLDTLVCGQPIASGQYTVTTRVVTGGCELTFDQDVEVVRAEDYNNIPELKGVANLVQRVELVITKLSFTDATTGTAVSLATGITSAQLSINGQVVVDKAGLSTLPKTVVLQGQALNQLKAKVDARQPASVHATCVAVVPDNPKPPAQLAIEYDAQPAIIVGTGKVF